MADRLRTICGQRILGAAWATHPGWTDVGEDCLNVNIYAPAVSSILRYMQKKTSSLLMVTAPEGVLSTVCI